MKLYDYFSISFNDLWRRKGRITLTAIGVIIGTVLIVAMIGLGLGLRNFMFSIVNKDNNLRSVIVEHYKSTKGEMGKGIDIKNYEEEYFKILNRDVIKSFKDIDGVASLRAKISTILYKCEIEGIEHNLKINLNGIDLNSEIFPREYIESLNTGRETEEPIIYGRNIKNKNEILIGETYLKSLNLKKEEILDKRIKIYIDEIKGRNIKPIFKEYMIVGIVNKTLNEGEEMIISAEEVADIKGFQTLQNKYMKERGYDKVELYVNSTDKIDKVIEEIEGLGYKYISSVEIAKEIDKKFKDISITIASIGIVVLIVAAIGIVNTMGMAVYDRRISIGIMKSVGASERNIKGIFLIESAFIGLVGGIFGVVIASGINEIIQIYLNEYIKNSGFNIWFNVGVPIYCSLGIVLFTTLIAILSGYYPASKAAKLEIVDALRG